MQSLATRGGLATQEVVRRLTQYGPNDALSRRRWPLWRQVLPSLREPAYSHPVLRSRLSAWTGQATSFFIIAAIILLSVVLDVVQQLRAENTVEALRQSVGLRTQVVRDGREQTIAVEQLVPGDVVRLTAGDIVPADCRLLAARDFFVNQALISGEPYPVEKHAGDLPNPAGEISEAGNFLFMGTSAISGAATAIVCRTGRGTELGKLAGTVAARRPPDAFEHGIRRFGLLMLRFTTFLVLFVLAANVVFHRPWLDLLLFALALAVGLTPELLPMVVTVTLANGAQRLAKRRVIVKRLAAIHDLGAMDVLCTDKTGTLTQSRIRLAGHPGTDGNDSEETLRLAYLNSAFESGIKSPLDEAILAHCKLDIADWAKVDEVPFDFSPPRPGARTVRAAPRAHLDRARATLGHEPRLHELRAEGDALIVPAAAGRGRFRRPDYRGASSSALPCTQSPSAGDPGDRQSSNRVRRDDMGRRCSRHRGPRAS